MSQLAEAEPACNKMGARQAGAKQGGVGFRTPPILKKRRSKRERKMKEKLKNQV